MWSELKTEISPNLHIVDGLDMHAPRLLVIENSLITGLPVPIVVSCALVQGYDERSTHRFQLVYWQHPLFGRVHSIAETFKV